MPTLQLTDVCNTLVDLAQQIAIYQDNKTEPDGLVSQKDLIERFEYQNGRFVRQARDGEDRISLAIRLGKMLYYAAQIRSRKLEEGQRLVSEVIFSQAKEHGLAQEEIMIAATTVMFSRSQGKHTKNPGLEYRKVQAALAAWKLEKQGGTIRIDFPKFPARTAKILEEWRVAEEKQSNQRAFISQLLIDLADAWEQSQSREDAILQRLRGAHPEVKRRVLNEIYEEMLQALETLPEEREEGENEV